jgi:hypothetical protein
MIGLMASTPQWVEVTKGILNIAQVIAIVGAAGWAYFKFVRGRTFAERLECSISASPFQSQGVKGVRVRIEVTNTGASIVRLRSGATVVYVYGATAASARPEVLPEWGERLVVANVLQEHENIEAQESVGDELVAVLPDRDWYALKAELKIVSSKRKMWSADSLVPASNQAAGDRSEHDGVVRAHADT